MIRRKEITSEIMSRIHSKDTKPEVFLRQCLSRKGYRYRKNYPFLPGKPDIVFLRKKIAIFVDGDFWHGNNWRLRKLKSRAHEFSNEKRTFWMNKIRSNILRDKKNNQQLAKEGYLVLRFWESDLKKNPSKIITQIEKAIYSSRPNS